MIEVLAGIGIIVFSGVFLLFVGYCFAILVCCLMDC